MFSASFSISLLLTRSHRSIANKLHDYFTQSECWSSNTTDRQPIIWNLSSSVLLVKSPVHHALSQLMISHLSSSLSFYRQQHRRRLLLWTQPNLHFFLLVIQFRAKVTNSKLTQTHYSSYDYKTKLQALFSKLESLSTPRPIISNFTVLLRFI